MHCLLQFGQGHDDSQNVFILLQWTQMVTEWTVRYWRLRLFTLIKIRNSKQMQRKLHTGNAATWRCKSIGHLNKRNIQKRREQQISNMIVCVCGFAASAVRSNALTTSSISPPSLLIDWPQAHNCLLLPHLLLLSCYRGERGSGTLFSSAGTDQGFPLALPQQSPLCSLLPFWTLSILALHRTLQKSDRMTKLTET